MHGTTLSKSCCTWTWKPRPESLWWTSTYKDEDMAALKVGSGGKTCDLPFKEVFGVLGCRFFHRDGKGYQGAELTVCKGMGSCRYKFICRSKGVSVWANCRRVHIHVCSTALNGANWPWRVAMLNKVWAGEAKIQRLTFCVLPFKPA